MNLYAYVATQAGSPGSSELSTRLAEWHDAMVAHERRARAPHARDAECVEDCPHQEARELWADAVAVFGDRANELAYLRSKGEQTDRRMNGTAR